MACFATFHGRPPSDTAAMKTTKSKVLLGLAAVAIGSAFVTSAHAGTSFRIGLGLPFLPPPPFVVSAPVPCAPQVVYTPVRECVPAVPVCPPPVVVVRPQPFWGWFSHYDSRNHERYERHEHSDRHEHGWHGDRR